MPDGPAPPAHTSITGRKQIAAGVPRAHPGWALQATPETTAEVIDSLALGVTTPAELSKRYGVTRAAVYDFRKRHDAAIRARRAELGSAFAEATGLWIADREARIQELQTAAERVIGLLQKADAADDPSYVAELSRTLSGLLHEAAEQLGQLPQRLAVQVNQLITYEVHGVDMSKLQ